MTEQRYDTDLVIAEDEIIERYKWSEDERKKWSPLGGWPENEMVIQIPPFGHENQFYCSRCSSWRPNNPISAALHEHKT